MAQITQLSVSGYGRKVCIADYDRRNDSFQAALTTAKRFGRRPEEVFRLLSTGAPLDDHFAHRPYLVHVHALFVSARKFPAVREAFLQLLLHTHRVCDWSGVEPVTPRYGGTFASALLAVARRYKEWRSPLADFKPSSHNARRQLRELLAHLFCEYPVPAFLESAWFRTDAEAKKQQDWFLHVGLGNNPRSLPLPVTLTKRMAHLVSTQVPANCSVEEGFRWAQIVGMGGSERLARAILGSRLAQSFKDEAFWETVLRFFVDNPLLDPAQVSPLVDYLWHERYSPRRVEDANRLPPEFTMKGRTVAALLARMEGWHKAIARAPRNCAESWQGSGFEGLAHDEEQNGVATHWTIEELTTAKALIAEGSAMEHCVGSYAPSCARGAVSVWSLRVRTANLFEPQRIMTVAVRSRAITEARGKRNAFPCANASEFGARMSQQDAALFGRGRRVVQKWARLTGLSLPPYLADGG